MQPGFCHFSPRHRLSRITRAIEPARYRLLPGSFAERPTERFHHQLPARFQEWRWPDYCVLPQGTGNDSQKQGHQQHLHRRIGFDLDSLRRTPRNGEYATSPLLQGENGIAKVRECLDNAASGNPWRFVAGQSEITTSEPRQIVRHCIGAEHFVGEHKLLYYGYSYDYAFTKTSDGKPDGFTVGIRPEPYGVAGIRSFLAVETSDVQRKQNLSVYATPQDRPATVNDPLALGSEVGLGFRLAKTEN